MNMFWVKNLRFLSWNWEKDPKLPGDALWDDMKYCLSLDKGNPGGVRNKAMASHIENWICLSILREKLQKTFEISSFGLCLYFPRSYGKCCIWVFISFQKRTRKSFVCFPAETNCWKLPPLWHNSLGHHILSCHVELCTRRASWNWLGSSRELDRQWGCAGRDSLCWDSLVLWQMHEQFKIRQQLAVGLRLIQDLSENVRPPAYKWSGDGHTRHGTIWTGAWMRQQTCFGKQGIQGHGSGWIPLIQNLKWVLTHLCRLEFEQSRSDLWGERRSIRSRRSWQCPGSRTTWRRFWTRRTDFLCVEYEHRNKCQKGWVSILCHKEAIGLASFGKKRWQEKKQNLLLTDPQGWVLSFQNWSSWKWLCSCGSHRVPPHKNQQWRPLQKPNLPRHPQPLPATTKVGQKTNSNHFANK